MNWRHIYAQWLKGRARRLKNRAFALEARAARLFRPVNGCGEVGFGESAQEFERNGCRHDRSQG